MYLDPDPELNLLAMAYTKTQNSSEKREWVELGLKIGGAILLYKFLQGQGDGGEYGTSTSSKFCKNAFKAKDLSFDEHQFHTLADQFYNAVWGSNFAASEDDQAMADIFRPVVHKSERTTARPGNNINAKP